MPGAVERAPQRIRQQHRPEPLPLTFLRDGQATDQRGAHQRVARDVLARRLRHIALRDRHGAQRVVAQHVGRLADLAQDEDGIRLSAHVLASLGLEIAIQAFHPTGKAATVVLLPEQHDPKVLRWPCRHSRHDPALMLRKRPLKPLARRRGTDQSIEEHSPIPVRQEERFMLRNRPPGSVRERGHAEIRQLAPFELRRPFDQSLGRFIDAKPKPLFPKPSVVSLLALPWSPPAIYVRRLD